MDGKDSVYVPGWDCHGLPIEWKIEEQYKKNKKNKNEVPIVEFRKECRSFAEKWIEVHKGQFKRLGVIGDWENYYSTMSYDAEAQIVRELGKFLKEGSLYRGFKPVLWSTVEKTALADAEVEYQDHKSDTIYTSFPVKSSNLKELEGSEIIIWTTTPWTIPANKALAYNEALEYVLIQLNDDGDFNNRKIVIAEALLDTVVKECSINDYKEIKKFKGKDFKETICNHPFFNLGYEYDIPMLEARFVTTEQGTGIVHCAPSHGPDDFNLCLNHGIKAIETVDGDGKYTKNVHLFEGNHIFKANPIVIEKLKEQKKLLANGELTHSYPHSWRSKAPLVHRATPQWFISMESHKLRETALKALDETTFYPSKGKERLRSMIETRPDWCVSRQRVWGVPLPIFVNKKTKEILVDDEVNENIANIYEKEGSDCWFSDNPQRFLGKKYKSENYEKLSDIVEVWFDSGSTHSFVLEKREDLKWPASMYLEGSDQHRGWFHSSLLESVGTRNKAPYKAALTHGYVVDGKGKKMSKSTGNVIAPQKIIDQHGAEILRLWVASENYREDIRVSNEILKRLTESYRKIRNTIRYLIGNLYDFDPKKDRVPLESLPQIDRYILIRFNVLREKILSAFENYEFHTFYHSFTNFCIVELSAFYLDILKDRVYTYPVNSEARRAGQTTLYILLMGMVRLIAPVLSFTAEEIWRYLPKGSAEEKSVHHSSFPDSENVEFGEELTSNWELLVQLKGEVSKASEASRRDKVIGHSLDSIVKLELPDSINKIVSQYSEELKFIFIVSKVELVDHLRDDEKNYVSDSLPGVKIFTERHPGQKCERCWHYFVAELEANDSLYCQRCQVHLKTAGE